VKYSFVYITCGSLSEAKKIAHSVVDEKLAACANIFPSVVSIYEWDGDVQEEQECVLIFKTTEEKTELLQKKVKKMHSYTTPCIIVLPIEGGDEDFLKWIAS